MYKVVFACNEDFIQHFSVALKSLLVNNERLSMDIYLLTENLSVESQAKILSITAPYPVSLNIIEVNSDSFRHLHLGAKHLKVQTFYRLLIPSLIDADRVLYLDSDIVITDSLKPLFEINFEDNYLLAVKDTCIPYAKRAKEKLKMSNHAVFFNAGVIVFNIKKWREDNVVQKILDYAVKNPDKIEYADQDSINAVINEKALILPLRYNIQYSLFDGNSKITPEIKNEIDNRCIVHYTGGYPYKPWYYACVNPLKSEYWKYLELTPFKNYKASFDFKGVIVHHYIYPMLRRMLKFVGLRKI